MGKLPIASDSENIDAPRDNQDALYLISTMADTTWRLFVPTLPLIMIGNHFDRQYDTKPWLLLLGSLIGALIAAWLIKLQLNRGK